MNRGGATYNMPALTSPAPHGTEASMSEPTAVFRDRASLSGTNSDSWLTGRSDQSAGDSSSELVENSTPPLVVISSRIRNPGEKGRAERDISFFAWQRGKAKLN